MNRASPACACEDRRLLCLGGRRLIPLVLYKTVALYVFGLATQREENHVSITGSFPTLYVACMEKLIACRTFDFRRVRGKFVGRIARQCVRATNMNSRS